jgi:hypothetical protein
MATTPLPADHLIRECPQKQAAVSWPLPVDMYLDHLVNQATAAGEKTNRKELTAALVATANFSDAQLERILKRYRKAKVRDLIPLTEGENVVLFEQSRPGPRTGSEPRRP